jgi:hypothetical protein
MSFVQLSLLFWVGAYSLAINGSPCGIRVRQCRTRIGVGFSTLAPSWMGGVVFLSLAVLAVAGFAAAAWMTAALLGLGTERGLVPVIEERAPEPVPALHALQLVRGFAAGLMRSH